MTPSPPARTSSVARSLAQAAAALRAQEWSGTRAYSDHPSVGATGPRRDWEQHETAAFYAELRARHRDLTQRQRRARAFYAQQAHYREDAESAAYRPQHAPPAAAGHFRSASNAPPARGACSRENVEVNRTQQVPEIQNKAPRDQEKEPEGEPAVVEEKKKKRVRYLRDTDRRNIIKRIENGEKQAALAREFGVTRAAICHIKKNRFEILSRYNLLLQSAQEMDVTENFVGPPGVEMMVHQVRANSVLLLMTMLRDNRSSGATFRRVAGRLIMILLEEALAILGTASVEVITGTGHLYRGLERRHRFCGVSIGAEGFPFLVLFHQMEPEAPQGSIHVEMATDRWGERAWRLDHMDLPANIIQHKVLLFSATCSTGEAECKAIEALCSVGCDECSISLVVILTASDGIINIGNRFPQVKIVTGGIDSKVDSQTDSIIPGFGDFVSRYNDP